MTSFSPGDDAGNADEDDADDPIPPPQSTTQATDQLNEALTTTDLNRKVGLVQSSVNYLVQESLEESGDIDEETSNALNFAASTVNTVASDFQLDGQQVSGLSQSLGQLGIVANEVSMLNTV